MPKPDELRFLHSRATLYAFRVCRMFKTVGGRIFSSVINRFVILCVIFFFVSANLGTRWCGQVSVPLLRHVIKHCSLETGDGGGDGGMWWCWCW